MLRPPLENAGRRLRDRLAEGPLLMPGAFSPLSALAAVRAGAEAVYLSGGATTNELLGVPDIGLATLDEMVASAERVCQVVPVPVLSDADTGFGEHWNVARAVISMERAGLAGIHLEDQTFAKRCGHLDGKEVIPAEQMETKIRSAVAAKRSPDFMVFARTDAVSIEGMPAAIDRARLYVAAGADGIFPEGLRSESEFAEFRAAVPAVPMLANMTEFGKTPLIPFQRFAELRYDIVIFPVSALRIMLRAIEEFYTELIGTGSQSGSIDKMRTRAELYALVEYEKYSETEISWTGQ